MSASGRHEPNVGEAYAEPAPILTQAQFHGRHGVTTPEGHRQWQLSRRHSGGGTSSPVWLGIVHIEAPARYWRVVDEYVHQLSRIAGRD
jgi:hypothetical protein